MWVAYRSTCRPTLGGYVDRDVLVNIATDISVEILADVSVEHRSICRLIVDRHIGRGVRKLHMIRVFLLMHFLSAE